MARSRKSGGKNAKSSRRRSKKKSARTRSKKLGSKNAKSSRRRSKKKSARTGSGKRKARTPVKRGKSSNRRVPRRAAFAARVRSNAQQITRLKRKLARTQKKLDRIAKTQRARLKRAKSAFVNLEKRLRLEEQKTRKMKEVIEDLARPTKFIFSEGGGEGEEVEEVDDQGDSYQHVPGERAVLDADGDLIGYELPPILDDVQKDMGFKFDSEVDWDQMIDDIGDEDEDLYGETTQ